MTALTTIYATFDDDTGAATTLRVERKLGEVKGMTTTQSAVDAHFGAAPSGSCSGFTIAVVD
jgi:hypothetical protein